MDCIGYLLPAAWVVEVIGGIPAGIALAHALHETARCTNNVLRRNNNPWGITRPVGPFPVTALPEDHFAQYPDLWQAAIDYVRFVNPNNHPRYAAAWMYRGDPVRYIEELDKAGYFDGRVKPVPGPAARAVLQIYRDERLDRFNGFSGLLGYWHPAWRGWGRPGLVIG